MASNSYSGGCRGGDDGGCGGSGGGDLAGAGSGDPGPGGRSPSEGQVFVQPTWSGPPARPYLAHLAFPPFPLTPPNTPPGHPIRPKKT